mgnify:CR=1 FL=1
MFKKTLLAALIGAISLAHASARWSEDSLAAARNQAEADINQYLKDGTGPVANLADADIRTWQANAK